MSIQARIHETTLTAETSSLVTNEIQRIDINATVTNERQVILRSVINFSKLVFLQKKIEYCMHNECNWKRYI